MIINLITINIFITDTFDLAKVIEIFTGKRIFVNDKNYCQLFWNYIVMERASLIIYLLTY